VPAALLQKLQSDVFVFSGMKTYTQLKEASLLLLDENKQIKPYHQFEQDILKIDNTYNRNYLQAEYQHATSAAQSASQWNDYMQDGNRYNLQIRTAGDDRVRESHAVLNGITLPAQHEFWKTHWTPFDWRCRCNIVQVLRDDYNESDIGIAHAAAQQAIPEMFRYNPGREGVIFPKKHPYYPQHCNGAKLNLTGLVGYATWLLDAENDRCKAMQVVKSMKEAEATVNIKQREKDYNKYSKNNNYTDAAFDKTTGGLKATHNNHNFNKNTGHHEKHVRDLLFNGGHKIILEDERTGVGKKVDGYLNNLSADISTILSNGKNTVVRALNHSKSKRAETAIVYFPDKQTYTEDKLNNAIARYNGQTEYRFKKIVVIVENEIVRQ